MRNERQRKRDGLKGMRNLGHYVWSVYKNNSLETHVCIVAHDYPMILGHVRLAPDQSEFYVDSYLIIALLLIQTSRFFM